jgi:hypothetical protein
MRIGTWEPFVQPRTNLACMLTGARVHFKPIDGNFSYFTGFFVQQVRSTESVDMSTRSSLFVCAVLLLDSGLGRLYVFVVRTDSRRPGIPAIIGPG